MIDSYANGKGKYQTEYDIMYADLVKSSGKSDTFAGEMIRAVSKLGHDFYNNGMGNNTSGALIYIRNYISSETYMVIYEYTRGRCYEGFYKADNLHTAMIDMTDSVVGCILHNPVLMTIPNEIDMYYLEEPEERFCYECGDSLDLESFGDLCEYCEESECA